jgi:putative endonuclease
LPYYVYILAVTNDLVRRVYEHRNDLVGGFTAQYGVHRLVYFEIHDDISRPFLARSG